jgi:hypothetical protein
MTGTGTFSDKVGAPRQRREPQQELVQMDQEAARIYGELSAIAAKYRVPYILLESGAYQIGEDRVRYKIKPDQLIGKIEGPIEKSGDSDAIERFDAIANDWFALHKRYAEHKKAERAQRKPEVRIGT